MSLTFSLQKPPLTTTFLHGTTTKPSLLPSFATLSLTTPPPSSSTSSPTYPVIKAMKSMQGRVITATNDKTVKVEIVRLAPHPKYKRRIRMKKKYQAHDPDNMFKVGDWVELKMCKPISKTKSFVAVVAENRNAPKPPKVAVVSDDIGIPLESQQQEEPTASV